MIRNKLPKGFNFVQPTDTIISAIEDVERDIRSQNTILSEMSQDLAKLKGRVKAIERDFKLIKKYVE